MKASLHFSLFILALTLVPTAAGQSKSTGQACWFVDWKAGCERCWSWNTHQATATTSNSSACISQQPGANRIATPSLFKSDEQLTGRASHSSSENDFQTSSQAGTDAQELAKKLSNPVASLISVPFQQNFDSGMGTGSGWRSTLNFQPVIPFVLSPQWNMISRTIVPFIHQHNVAGTGNQTGLGDISQSFFFSPRESKRFVWAVGPVLSIPTATDDLLGSEKFGIGPTFLILKQKEGWTYGALTNHIWSVAGNDSRAAVNNTFIQPFLSYNTKDAWTYGLNAESSYDWVGNHWSVPIHFSISKLIKFGHQPVSVGGALRCWATSPDGGPEGCGLRIIVTPLFPR